MHAVDARVAVAKALAADKFAARCAQLPPGCLVALAALKGDKTLAQLSSEFGVCSVQISQWKAQLLQQLPNAFQHQERPVRAETLTAPLYQEIGRLKMELDWLKKKAGVDA